MIGSRAPLPPFLRISLLLHVRHVALMSHFQPRRRTPKSTFVLYVKTDVRSGMTVPPYLSVPRDAPFRSASISNGQDFTIRVLLRRMSSFAAGSNDLHVVNFST